MKKAPIKSGDYHLIVTDKESEKTSLMNCFNASGKLQWTRPCLAKGQTADYTKHRGDTPPGIYVLSSLTITQDWENLAIWNSFGYYFFDMGEVSGAEERYGRSGCGIHGGGSNALDPLAPYQPLLPTFGCVRMHNEDIERYLLPLWTATQAANRKIYLTVDQR